MSRLGFLTVLILGALLAVVGPARASRADHSLRDGVYISPTWGYSVRWYEDEWSIVAESSQDGTDSLWLQDTAGARLGFEGRRGYSGDARDCLDDVMAKVATVYGDQGSVLRDEAGHPQKIVHPWRSWIALLVSRDKVGKQEDIVLYLDCRTLSAGEAVLIRYLAVPATALTDEDWHFDPLNVAFPRSAWAGNAFIGLSAPLVHDDSATPPFPVDSLFPWDFPDDPHLLVGELGKERAMLTQVDGDNARRTYVVMIENIGTDPLSIDPAQFSDSNNPQEARPDADIAPSRATWDDGAAPGLRVLAPGTWASLTLEFPPPSVERTQPSFLVYWDSATEGGAVMLDCLDDCGYGGGGSRPRLRLSR